MSHLEPAAVAGAKPPAGADGPKPKRAGVSAAYISSAPTLERDMPAECDLCGSDDIVENVRQGMLICRDCGAVLSRQLFDLGTEWRTFAGDEGGADPNRVGGPSNPLYQTDNATGVDAADKSAFAAGVRGTAKAGNSAAADADKQLRVIEEKIRAVCERGMLHRRVQDRALEIFKRYQDFKTLKADGTKNRALKTEEKNEMVAAAIYTACKTEGWERQLGEISSLTQVSRKRINATNKDMNRNLENLTPSRAQNPETLVPRFVTNLNLPAEYIGFVSHVAKQAWELPQICGKTYQTIVATSIFIICSLGDPQHRREAKAIGAVAGAAEATIRSAKSEIGQDLERILPPDFTPTIPLAVFAAAGKRKAADSIGGSSKRASHG